MAVVSDHSALFSGAYWYPGGPARQAAFVTFSFLTEPTDYVKANRPGAVSTFAPFRESDKALVRDALRAWSEVSGLTIVETTRHEGDLTFGFYDLGPLGAGGFAGLANYPISGAYYSGGVPKVYSGDFQSGGEVYIERAYLTGGFSMSGLPHVLLHEIGHALGLKHPHGGPDTLVPYLDDGAASVMSYNAPFANTLGWLDLPAIQDIYGTPSGANRPVGWHWNPGAETFTVTANVSGQYVRGSGARDVVYVTGANNAVVTTQGDDVIYTLGQAIEVNMGTGYDRLNTGLSYAGLRYGVGGAGSGFRYVYDPTGTILQTYLNVEQLGFADGVYYTSTSRFIASTPGLSIPTNVSDFGAGTEISDAFTGAIVDTLPSVDNAEMQFLYIGETRFGRNLVSAAAMGLNPAQLRDYSGNDLGAYDGWRMIGLASVRSNQDPSYLLVNPVNGRWAEVAGRADGVFTFGNHGLNGDTRIVGIYEDPLIRLGLVVRGTPHDSQTRFMDDIHNDRLAVLGSADYDHDGFVDLFFKLTNHAADHHDDVYLRAIMHHDGNIYYANYMVAGQLTDWMARAGVQGAVYDGWMTQI